MIFPYISWLDSNLLRLLIRYLSTGFSIPQVTGLPPYLGMMMALGVFWLVSLGDD
jgi:hypothetical protein